MKTLVRYTSLLLCSMAFVAGSTQVQAQGISPVVQEYNKKARGAVQIANLSDTPKYASCKAQGFDPDEHGAVVFHPLDAALHVRIDTGREVLPAKGSRQISFDATPAVLPAWFTVTCRFLPVERGPGLTLAYELTSVVIIHGGHLDAHDVALSAKHMGSKVVVEVKNNGSGLARVDSGEIRGEKKHADIATFLLFPNQKHIVEVDWKETASPETVRIQIGKLRMESPVN